MDAKTHKELEVLNRLFICNSYDKVPSSWALPWVKNGGNIYTIPVQPGDLM
jgi:hypothetical protein